MNIKVFRHIVESFFRRWPVYALLFAIVAVLGAVTFLRTEASYTSSGTIFVDNESLVTTQSGIQDGGFFSYLSPAQFTSQELNGLLQTDVFVVSVLDRAGVTLEDDPSDRADQVARLRAGMSSYPSSQNLVTINVSSPDPGLSFELAVAIIAEFVQFQIGLDVAESGASEDFFSDLAQSYVQDLEAARQAVDAALRSVDDASELTLAQELEIERLKDAEALAESRYQSAADEIEVAKLAKLQTETDIRQSYSTFDPPQRPNQAEDDLFQSASVLLLIAAAGTALALAWPVVSGFTDRTVLFGEDLEVDSTPVLGLVPRIPKRSIRLKHVDPSGPGIDDDGDHEAMLGSVYDRAAKTTTFVPASSSRQPSERSRSESQSPPVRTGTHTGRVDGSSRSEVSTTDKHEATVDEDDSEQALTTPEPSALDGQPVPVDDTDLVGKVLNEQEFFAGDGPVADEPVDNDAVANQTQHGLTEPAQFEPDDETSPHEPEPHHAAMLMSWAAPVDDAYRTDEGFVVVETEGRSSGGDRSHANDDDQIDDGDDDPAPQRDPSVTTELHLPPDIPAVTRRRDEETDGRHSDGDEPLTTRPPHA